MTHTTAEAQTVFGRLGRAFCYVFDTPLAGKDGLNTIHLHPILGVKMGRYDVYDKPYILGQSREATKDEYKKLRFTKLRSRAYYLAKYGDEINPTEKQIETARREAQNEMESRGGFWGNVHAFADELDSVVVEPIKRKLTGHKETVADRRATLQRYYAEKELEDANGVSFFGSPFREWDIHKDAQKMKNEQGYNTVAQKIRKQAYEGKINPDKEYSGLGLLKLGGEEIENGVKEGVGWAKRHKKAVAVGGAVVGTALLAPELLPEGGLGLGLSGVLGGIGLSSILSSHPSLNDAGESVGEELRTRQPASMSVLTPIPAPKPAKTQNITPQKENIVKQAQKTAQKQSGGLFNLNLDALLSFDPFQMGQKKAMKKQSNKKQKKNTGLLDFNIDNLLNVSI